MANNINCTCGHSWSKASSSKKDMNVCHICGKDNTMRDGGWLNKFEQGGMVLEQQRDDNYGKKANPNDVQVSVGPDFVGLGYNIKGRNYSPAWGGQFQDGGFLQPISYKLPSRYRIPYAEPSTELATSIGGGPGEPAYLIPTFKYGKPLQDPEAEYRKTGEHLGGPFKTYQEAEKWEQEIRHPYVEKGKPIPTPLKRWGDMAMGGGIPGAVGFTYARVAGSAPSNGKYAKKTKASAQNGKEMKFYQEGLDFKPNSIAQDGEAIVDPMGQWAHPGEVTIIPATDITMEGVDYPVLGISDTGDQQMMYPGEDYDFDGEYVTEYPMMKEGGWLSKYQDGGGVLSRSNLETMSALEKDIKNQKARDAQLTISQYTPKPGDQERMNATKDAYRKEQAKPLNRLANNPHIIAGDKNLPGGIEFALDVMTAGEATAALNTIAKPALKAAGKYLTKKTALKNASIINKDAAGSIDDVINKWWRRETAPGTKHKDAINVLSEFKQRIKTPEGQKRLKELGISNDEFLQKLKIIEDNTEYGYYNDGKIGLHKDVPNASTVTRHEIEHGVQGALGRDALMAAKKGTVDDKMAALSVGPTKIDDILSKLELRKTPNKVVRRPENLNDIYLDPYEFNRRMSDKQAATDYFTYGSEGREKSAFAAEAQQYMLDKGIIKHPYENITPDKVRNAMIEAQFDKETYPIRLFHIMKNTDNNYKTVSDALNKMLTVSPILAGGTATLTGSKEKKNGGWLNKYK